MSDWTERRAWLTALKGEIPEDLTTPLDVARYEAGSYFAPVSGRKPVRLRVDEALGDGYEIADQESEYLIRGGEKGILYGVYALIRAVECGEDPACGIRQPACALRMIDCWDNMDGSVERGYAGRSLWFEGGRFDYDPRRIRQLGRMLASVGINVLAINNVNVHWPAQRLIDDMLGDVQAFAALLRPFGVRLMLSIDFSQPMRHGEASADPASQSVASWWAERARMVWDAIPDLCGFLVKADSEHRPGPNNYGRTHAQGANMLARAVAPLGGVIVWRAFVYNCMQDWRDTKTDRPKAAYETYHPLDGQFDDNVILQVKYGPFDFQPREPVSPLFFGMDRTRLALEVQLAQEYTGQQIDLFAMPPLWREIIDTIGPRRVRAMAAVSNLGRDANWTGHPFAALNLFAFGLFAWDPCADPAAVIRAWVRLSYPQLNESQALTLERMLMTSRDVYEQYTAPLGLCWMVTPNSHYGPNPYGYEFQAWGTYNRADRYAVGVDRTRRGTDYVSQYPAELAALYDDPATCPEKLLLFFHRLKYDHVMRDGRTLIQCIYDDHFEGAARAEKMAMALGELDLPEPDRAEAAERMTAQVANAREWRDIVNTFFHRFSGVPDAHGRRIYD